MYCKSLILGVLLIAFSISVHSQSLFGFTIDQTFDSLDLDESNWQIMKSEGKSGMVFCSEPEDSNLATISLHFDANDKLYNVMCTSKSGASIVRALYSSVLTEFQGGKKGITGACSKGPIYKYLWVKGKVKLDYKEECKEDLRATINIMRMK